MSPKEKQVAIGGSLILAALLLVQFVVRPANHNIEKEQALVADSDQALQELRTVSANCLQLQAELEKVHERVARQKADAEPLSVLEGMETECGLARTNVRGMTPEQPVVADHYSQTKITIRLESISEDQMRKLVNRIQQSADLAMGVRSLDLKTSRGNNRLLDATIEVVVVKPAAKG